VRDQHALPTGERGGNNLNGFKDIRTENGSRQGQNLALTGLCVPRSLDSTNQSPVVLKGGARNLLLLEEGRAVLPFRFKNNYLAEM